MLGAIGQSYDDGLADDDTNNSSARTQGWCLSLVREYEAPVIHAELLGTSVPPLGAVNMKIVSV